MGVLVAVSIPIFTSQLKKARLATNQANARAAYAAVVAELLDEGKSAGQAEYTVATAKVGTTSDPAASNLTITAAPQAWGYEEGTNVTYVNAALGNKTATGWKVNIANDGTVSYEAVGLN